MDEEVAVLTLSPAVLLALLGGPLAILALGFVASEVVARRAFSEALGRLAARYGLSFRAGRGLRGGATASGRIDDLEIAIGLYLGLLGRMPTTFTFARASAGGGRGYFMATDPGVHTSEADLERLLAEARKGAAERLARS